MNSITIHIKNVVCQRCISTIQKILEDKEIPYSQVTLGEAHLNRPLNEIEKSEIRAEFAKVGFEFLESREEQIINHIKSVIINEVYNKNASNKKLSEILSEQVNYDYSHITHIFTEHEQQSIQKFYNAVKIERAKELLEYDDYSISMIADELGYSTAAYLSTSFRKATGKTPSEYKKMKKKTRINLDSV